MEAVYRGHLVVAENRSIKTKANAISNVKKKTPVTGTSKDISRGRRLEHKGARRVLNCPATTIKCLVKDYIHSRILYPVAATEKCSKEASGVPNAGENGPVLARKARGESHSITVPPSPGDHAFHARGGPSWPRWGLIRPIVVLEEEDALLSNLLKQN